MNKEDGKIISAKIEEGTADIIEDTMWEVNISARNNGVRDPRCSISDVVRELINCGIKSKEKIKKDLLKKELNNR